MKKKLIATGLITVLAASNGYMTYTYIKETEALKNGITKLQQENKEKDEQITYLGNNIIKLQNELNDEITENEKLNEELEGSRSQIDKLEQQLEKAQKDNESPSVSSTRRFTMTVTAYIDSCQGCSGVTSSGVDIRGITEYQGYKIIAADLSVLPMYSIVEIKTKTETFKAIVLDTGGAIKGEIIDYLVGSYEEAINFGRQQATVNVLREGKG